MSDVRCVRPTHSCFDDSLDLMNDILRWDPRAVTDLRLVHAICKAPDGHEYAHAWVEDLKTGRVLFVGIIDGERVNLAAPKAEYYAYFAVQDDRTAYTYRQAVMENRRANSYGPWLDRYRVLCSARADEF